MICLFLRLHNYICMYIHIYYIKYIFKVSSSHTSHAALTPLTQLHTFLFIFTDDDYILAETCSWLFFIIKSCVWTVYITLLFIL